MSQTVQPARTDLLQAWPGPRTRARRRRALAVLSVVWAVGLGLVLTGDPFLTGVGVGLWLPGAGFLIGPHWFLVFPAILLTGWAVLRTISRGDYVAPVLVWLLSAWFAGEMSHGMRATWPPVVVPVVIAGLLVRAFGQRRREVAAVPTVPAVSTARAEVAVPVHGEHSDEDLAVIRWAIDHGLRDESTWDGFDQVDQYTLKSLRYQLNWLQWTLALAHATATPAFDGVSAIAQRRLIDRMTRPEVWSYWRRENLWGNLRPGADPIPRDNIMFSGYLLAMLGSYRAVTGDARYDQAASLTFADGRRRYEHDHGTVADAVERNFGNSEFALFPCEPGLVFPLCNAVALAGLAMRDESRAASTWPRYHGELVQEFTFPDGLIPFFSMTRLGVSPYRKRDQAGTAIVAAFLSAVDPDYAARTWDRLQASGLELPSTDTRTAGRDWGTGRPSHVTTLAFLGTLAGAVGDDSYRSAAIGKANELLDLRIVDGVAAYEGASVTGNGMLGMCRFSGAGAWRRLVTEPAPAGPRLAEAAYPDVLVRAATTDGAALRLRLSSGQGPQRSRLRLRGLRPDREYAVTTGTLLRADSDGSATVELDLDDTVSDLTFAPA